MPIPYSGRYSTYGSGDYLNVQYCMSKRFIQFFFVYLLRKLKKGTSKAQISKLSQANISRSYRGLPLLGGGVGGTVCHGSIDLSLI